MSELTDTIVHVAYRFKPEGSDKYITTYFETSLIDVIIPEQTRPALLGAENMQEFCNLLMDKMKTERPIYQQARAYDPERIYPKDKFLYESDTGKLKVGDGIHKYKELNYFGYDAGSSGKEYIATDRNVALTLIDDQGIETVTVVPETIEAFPPSAEPDPATYADKSYAVLSSEPEPEEEPSIEG